MMPYIKTYLDYFDYTEGSYMPCEACESRVSDVHHIYGRGKGRDVITNLIGLCRGCHNKAHSSKEYISKEQFQEIHNNFLKRHEKRI
jgi:5-methylcytosine-specific restriction endonuclease McrA